MSSKRFFRYKIGRKQKPIPPTATVYFSPPRAGFISPNMTLIAGSKANEIIAALTSIQSYFFLSLDAFVVVVFVSKLLVVSQRFFFFFFLSLCFQFSLVIWCHYINFEPNMGKSKGERKKENIHEYTQPHEHEKKNETLEHIMRPLLL